MNYKIIYLHSATSYVFKWISKSDELFEKNYLNPLRIDLYRLLLLRWKQKRWVARMTNVRSRFHSFISRPGLIKELQVYTALFSLSGNWSTIILILTNADVAISISKCCILFHDEFLFLNFPKFVNFAKQYERIGLSPN